MLKSRLPLQGGAPFPCRLGLVYFAKGVWPVSAHPWGRASGGGNAPPRGGLTTRCARGAGRWGRGKHLETAVFFFFVPRLLLPRGAHAVRALPQGEMPDALTAAGLVSPGLGLSSVAFCAVVQAGLG